jgi:Protein of unknown function (DUF5818)
MRKPFQPWWLGAAAALLSMGIALNAQQTAPQGQSTGQQGQYQQTQPATPPATQHPAPPTSDEPAPPPTAQPAPPDTQTGTQPGAAPGAPPESGQNGSPAAPPQSQPPASPNNGTPQQAAPPPSGAQGASAAPANGVQTFSGTIVKQGDRYMLQQDATGQTYDLDHQDEVQKFAGKRVRVHGTLDPTGKMIHLQ